MKTLFIILTLTLAISPIRASNEWWITSKWTDSEADDIRELTKTMIIPITDFHMAEGSDVLQIIRTMTWRLSSLTDKPINPSFEFRCNPTKLEKSITHQTNGLTYAQNLDGVCAKLGIMWTVEKGRIVFLDKTK